MIDCFCDYDYPDVYRASIVAARKQYHCEECGALIPKGAKHEYHFGKVTGQVYTGRTCAACVDLRNWTQNNVPCVCWSHGNMLDDCQIAIEEAIVRAPEETRGLWIGWLRRRYGDVVQRRMVKRGLEIPGGLHAR